MIYSINMHTTVYQFWRFVYHHEQSGIDHYARSSFYTRSFCTAIKLYVGHFLWPPQTSHTHALYDARRILLLLDREGGGGEGEEELAARPVAPPTAYYIYPLTEHAPTTTFHLSPLILSPPLLFSYLYLPPPPPLNSQQQWVISWTRTGPVGLGVPARNAPARRLCWPVPDFLSHNSSRRIPTRPDLAIKDNFW